MSDIKDILRQLLKDNEEIYSVIGEVMEVNEVKRVCKVKPIDDSAELFNVRLQTKVSSEIGLVLFPKIGSQITATFLNKQLAFVSQTEEIEKIKLTIGDLSLFIDKDNFETNVKNKKNTVDNYDVIAKNAKFEIDTLFEVISQAQIVMQANEFLLTAGAVNINGVTTITGATTVNGLTTVNGAAVIVGAMSAASATIVGAGSFGGGNNGGVPKGNKIAEEVNKIVADINNLKSKLKSWVPINNDGGAKLKTLIASYANTDLNDVQTSNIVNENLTH